MPQPKATYWAGERCGIYKIANLVSGSIYIGSSVRMRTRWNEHHSQLQRGVHANLPLQQAWAKYGKESLVFSVLLVCEVEDRIEYEKKVIAMLSPEYNIAEPGENPMLGRKHSLESRQKMSKALMGKKHTQEWVENLRERMKGNTQLLGHIHSEESRRKMSQSSKHLYHPKSPEGLAQAKLKAFIASQSRPRDEKGRFV